jgi:Uncharacterized protein conserved in bacteria (DUF2087)
MSVAEPSKVLAALAALVLKDGVMLGGLAAGDHAAALGLAWCALPSDAVLRETDVNAVLKRCLADECRFLDVDHVELRRWLVDTGWLVRDGFGREYRRVAAADLPPELATVAAALQTIDPPRWVAGVRAADAQQRAERRRAWEARHSGAVGKGSP